MGDIAAGLFAAVGILSALHERERTGLGQMVDIAMLDCQVAILENAIARYSATGLVPGPLGARHPSITPFDAYRASDRPLVIAAGNDTLFTGLCETLGRPDLAGDHRFATNEARTEHAVELGAEMEEALSTDTAAAWLDRLIEAGIPALRCSYGCQVGDVAGSWVRSQVWYWLASWWLWSRPRSSAEMRLGWVPSCWAAWVTVMLAC